MALIAGVIAADTRARSIFRVTGSISTNTGRAPTSRITLLVATQESGVVMTSWPGPIPAIRNAISIVQVPELKTRTGRSPQAAESLASSSFTFGPDVIQPERRTSATPAIVSSSIVGRVSGRKGADISGLVTDQTVGARLRDQMITKCRISEQRPRCELITLPNYEPDAA